MWKENVYWCANTFRWLQKMCLYEWSSRIENVHKSSYQHHYLPEPKLQWRVLVEHVSFVPEIREKDTYSHKKQEKKLFPFQITLDRF